MVNQNLTFTPRNLIWRWFVCSLNRSRTENTGADSTMEKDIGSHFNADLYLPICQRCWCQVRATRLHQIASEPKIRKLLFAGWWCDMLWAVCGFLWWFWSSTCALKLHFQQPGRLSSDNTPSVLLWHGEICSWQSLFEVFSFLPMRYCELCHRFSFLRDAYSRSSFDSCTFSG